MAWSPCLQVHSGSDLSACGYSNIISFYSKDEYMTTGACRNRAPIGTCSRSFTKWLKFYSSTSPDAATVTDIKIFSTGSVDTSTSIFIGATCTASPPSHYDSGIATSNLGSATSADKIAWDSGSYTGSGAIDTYAVFQFDVASDASPKDWTDNAFYVQWTEGTGACQTGSTLTGDGYLWGTDASSYTDARDTVDSGCTATSSVGIGQLNDAGAFTISRAYLGFNTAGIAPDDVVGASLFVQAESGTPASNFNVQCYRYSWSTPLESEANWDGAIGANASLQGTLHDISSASWEPGTWYSLEVATSTITRTGNTGYVLLSSCDVANSSPAGDDRIWAFSGDTTACAPYLDILTSSHMEFTMKAKISKRLRKKF